MQEKLETIESFPLTFYSFLKKQCNELYQYKQTRREKVVLRIYPKIGMHRYVRRWTGQYVAYDALLMTHSDG